MYVAVKIYNNALGKIVEANDEEDAKSIIKAWAEDQFQRPLDEDEQDSLDHDLEIVNEEDLDNIYCFSVGIVE